MYTVQIQLTDEEKEKGEMVIKLDTKGQARKLVEATKGHNIKVTSISVKEINF